MSRKLVVATMVAAGLTALGSAASAVSLDLSPERVKGMVTGNTNLDKFAIDQTNGNTLQFPPRTSDIRERVGELRTDLNREDVSLGTERAGNTARRLANSVTATSTSLKRQNAHLPGGKAKAGERLTASLDRAATQLNRVPTERVTDRVSAQRLSHGLYRLESSMTRMERLDSQDVLSTNATGDVLDTQKTKSKLTGLAKQLRLVQLG